MISNAYWLDHFVHVCGLGSNSGCYWTDRFTALQMLQVEDGKHDVGEGGVGTYKASDDLYLGVDSSALFTRFDEENP